MNWSREKKEQNLSDFDVKEKQRAAFQGEQPRSFTFTEGDFNCLSLHRFLVYQNQTRKKHSKSKSIATTKRIKETMKPSIDSKAIEASPQIDAKSEAVQLFFSDMLSQVEEDFEKSGDSLMIRMKNMCSKMDDLEQSE